MGTLKIKLENVCWREKGNSGEITLVLFLIVENGDFFSQIFKHRGSSSYIKRQ